GGGGARGAGVSGNARAGDQRSSRMGPGVATVPAGRATTTVRPSWGPRLPALNVAVTAPLPDADAHGVLAPCGPSKHATAVDATGAVTVGAVAPIDPVHSVPIAFQ